MSRQDIGLGALGGALVGLAAGYGVGRNLAKARSHEDDDFNVIFRIKIRVGRKPNGSTGLIVPAGLSEAYCIGYGEVILRWILISDDYEWPANDAIRIYKVGSDEPEPLGPGETFSKDRRSITGDGTNYNMLRIVNRNNDTDQDYYYKLEAKPLGGGRRIDTDPIIRNGGPRPLIGTHEE